MLDKPPDPGWYPIIRGSLIAYCFTLMTVLALVIAWRKVTEQDSFGLPDVVKVIAGLTALVIVKRD